ncbi:MAG TPA: hypothetical protein DCZ94_13595 [Lentisphaeria bacterium]|nr:MAG: hypothetical protein A2X48_11170 [Lentisphaerae bacterium GWF2_49_21]HBC87979.1 hypothetical protein [Lentisphaeria bacterium]
MKSLLKTDLICEAIQSHISNGNLKSGDMIYSESELMSIYNVSRITVRNAIRDLKSRGVLLSVKGKGTFVNLGRRLAEDKINIQIIEPFLSGPDNSPEWGAALVIDELEKTLRVRNKHINLSVAFTRGDVDLEKETVKRAAESREINIVVFEPICNSLPEVLKETIRPLVDSGKLFIVLEQPASLDVNCVYEDDLAGSYMATNHLIKLGHKDILHINLDCPYLERRLIGYRKALVENGLPVRKELEYRHPVRIEDSKYQLSDSSYVEIGYRAVKDTCGKIPYTAIFAINDLVAEGCRKALSEIGLKVPEDISLVGYDDMPFTRNAGFLTTIERPFADIGKAAANFILKDIKDFSRVKCERTGVNPRLVIRKSTKKI